jgi:hypothetical protein
LDHGVRPVVCLKSDVNARKNEDGTWNLNKNTENNNTNSENDKKIVGEWSATGTNNNTEYSLMYLYGTSLSYANELTFNEDGTYKLAIGVAYYQEGNYEIDGNTIKLVNTEYKGDNPDSQLIEKLSIKDNQIILEETYDNEIVDVIFENKGNITNDENTNTSNANASNTNLTTTENTNQSTENNNSGELKIGNHTIKYGTYNGIDAATGDILIINSNQTATLNGENYTYTVGKHDFAQDSSGSSYQDAIIFKTASGETSFALYVGNDNNLYNDPMCYVYSGN